MGATRSPAWACALVVAAAAHDAPAAVSSYRLQLVRGEGAGSCPSGTMLERDVSQRLGRSPFSEAAERGIEVVIERAEGAWRARLYLRVDASSTDAARVIESDAPDCSELGKAVALAVALAIAPELPPESPPEPPAEPDCPPALPPPPLPPPQPETWAGAASLRATFSPNLLPHGALGAALSVSFRGDLLGANVGGLFYPEKELRTGDARLGFGLSAAFASGCLWPRTRDPQVWSCIGAQLGALHSVVYSPVPSSPGDRIWWAASSELGIRQTLAGRLFAEAGAAAVFPFVRHRFAVSSEATGAGARVVYEQGPAVVEAFLGLGLRLD